jgi:hypothetical protein
MRLKLSLVTVVALTGGTVGVLLATTPASARPCPDGTSYQVVTTVAGHQVGTCLPTPYPQCDPGPCDPTAAPPRD